MTDHDILLGKFRAITKALDEDSSYVDFRKSMFEAYGIVEEFPRGIQDPHEAVKEIETKEFEFARQCLEGRGPNATQAFSRTGDMREVMLIEIGTHQDPPEFPKKPWLMGDWQFLAERIVGFILDEGSDAESSDIGRHQSAQVVRVWPTVRGSWKDIGDRVLSKGHLVEVDLDLNDMGNRSIKIRSNKDTWNEAAYNWIVLPTGPGVLTHSDGIPAHLWTGFRVDDGT